MSSARTWNLAELPDVVNSGGPILAVGMVRNEADIIEAMVRHNLAYADHIHLVDDQSVDGTTEILLALADETGRVSVESIEMVGFRKGKIMRTIAARQARQRNAGHVMLLDADEAIIGDPAAFRSHLLQSRQPVALPWITYVPTRSDHVHDNPFVRIRHRRNSEKPQFLKLTIPFGLTGKVWFDNGYHDMRSEGRVLPKDRAHPFALAHFPVRSPDQLAGKVLIGSWNYRLNPDSVQSNGRHWKMMADDILINGIPDLTRLQELAQSYPFGSSSALVDKPLVLRCEPDLRYAAFAQTGLLRKVIAFAEAMVGERERTRKVPEQSDS
jgi:glycosyltransferase involved in cell wall biosynthesis